MEVNPGDLNPIKNRRYNLSDEALQQRCLAAKSKRPRLGKRQRFLELVEKLFCDEKFQKALLRGFRKVFEEQYREFTGKL